METAWLEDFLAVLDEGGFSRGADEVPIDICLFRPKARQAPAAEALWSRAVQAAKNPASSASVSSGSSS